MTAASPRSFPLPTHHSRVNGSRGVSEMSFRKSRRGALTPEAAERAWFAGLLWKAFPDASSENELAEIAAEVLTKDNRPVTSRTVKNWIACENTPHFRYVLAVIALVGAEAVFQVIDPEAAW